MEQLTDLCSSLLHDGCRVKLDKYHEEKSTASLNRQKPYAVRCRRLENGKVLGGIPTHL